MNLLRFGLVLVLLASSLSYAAVERTKTAFPLRVDESGRYLADSAGNPFFYNADTAWMLFLKLNHEEAEDYMAERFRQGFNTIQVQLTGFLGQKNKRGDLPFDEKNDFSKPNNDFFAHIDAVVQKAREMNLLLAIAPLWAGCCGEGWCGKNKDGSPKPMNANGVESCRELGRYLGDRYGRFPNIVWILGGDNDPGESRDHIRALAEGIKAAAPHHLCTYHAASSHSSTDVWENESWLDVPMVYTYFRGFNKAWNKNQPDVYEVCYAEYDKKPVKPFFLGESTYEGEHDAWGSALQARKQAYWCALSGGFGNAYGSNNWNVPDNWRDVLQYPGAKSLKFYRQLFETHSWHTLVPDRKNEWAVEGRGVYAENDYATTAAARDGSLVLTYFPSKRTIAYDFTKFPKGKISAEWYDPTSGAYHPATEAPLGNQGIHRFTPPGKNADGDNDWILVLDSGIQK